MNTANGLLGQSPVNGTVNDKKRKRLFKFSSSHPKKKRKKTREVEDPDYVYPDFSHKKKKVARKRNDQVIKRRKPKQRRRKEKKEEDDNNPQNFTVIRKKGRQYMKQCTSCGCKSPPCWRKGPKGVGSLCNACGLRWKNKRLVLDLRTGGKVGGSVYPPLLPLRNEIVMDIDSDYESGESSENDNSNSSRKNIKMGHGGRRHPLGEGHNFPPIYPGLQGNMYGPGSYYPVYNPQQQPMPGFFEPPSVARNNFLVPSNHYGRQPETFPQVKQNFMQNQFQIQGGEKNDMVVVKKEPTLTLAPLNLKNLEMMKAKKTSYKVDQSVQSSPVEKCEVGVQVEVIS